MKLVTFIRTNVEPSGAPESAARLGVLIGESTDARIVDLAAVRTARDEPPFDAFRSMLDWLDGGEAARDATERTLERAAVESTPESVLKLGECRLLAPLVRPRSIRDCLAFEQHLIDATRTVVGWRAPWLSRFDRFWQRHRGRSLLAPPLVWYERPIYYKGNPHSVVGPDAEVLWPRFTERLDYELEFAAVIGRPGRDVSEADAARHIAGYVVFNDFSARDLQMREMQGRLGPAKSKDFDTGNAIGPYLVTADEVGDPQSLAMSARVNGELWSQGSSAQMHFSFAEIVAYISRDETLYPGDLIGSGTVPSGCGLELNRWIQPGDTIELTVERLGTLRNRIIRHEPS